MLELPCQPQASTEAEAKAAKQAPKPLQGAQGQKQQLSSFAQEHRLIFNVGQRREKQREKEKPRHRRCNTSI